MTHPSTTASSRVPSLSALPWWITVGLPVAIFLVGRLASSVLMVWLAHEKPAPTGDELSPLPNPLTGLALHNRWDAEWYERIVTDGYPSALPRNDDGQVIENQWAFFPLYPVLLTPLTRLGLDFTIAGIVVSLAFGALAMVLLFRMLVARTNVFTGALTVTALSFSPASLTFGLPYSESLALALILLCLILLTQRRPVAFLLAALALSLARPVAPALATVVGIVWLIRWAKRRVEPFPTRERITWALIAVTTAALFLLWPATTAVATGEWNAYALTQKAWLPDLDGWGTWLSLTFQGHAQAIPTLLILLGAVLVALRYARSWPLTLRIWAVVYPLYILGASRPTFSIVRYLTLTAATAWPLPDLSSQARTTAQRIVLVTVVVVVGVALQAAWIYGFWLSVTGVFP